MFTLTYFKLGNDYKIAKYQLQVLIDKINWYQTDKQRLKKVDYTRTVNKADKMCGEIIEIEEKLDLAYIQYNS